MARSSATAVAPKPPTGRSGPPASPSRRELLLDAAAQIVAEGHADEVTMEAVATRAGVSRSLVYKHFAHRQELLGVVYERESSLLHRQLSAAVQDCARLEDMLRALVEGALSAQATRSATFVALAAEGARPAGQRARQRRRDGRTLRYFTDQAVGELGIDRDLAEASDAHGPGRYRERAGNLEAAAKRGKRHLSVRDVRVDGHGRAAGPGVRCDQTLMPVPAAYSGAAIDIGRLRRGWIWSPLYPVPAHQDQRQADGGSPAHSPP